MSDDLGEFLKEAARRRKERREQTAKPAPRPRNVEPTPVDSSRSTFQSERERRENLSDRSALSHRETIASQEAAHLDGLNVERRRGFATQDTMLPATVSATPVTSNAPSAAPLRSLDATARVEATPLDSDVAALLKTLRSPSGLRQAFLMAEILRPRRFDW